MPKKLLKSIILCGCVLFAIQTFAATASATTAPTTTAPTLIIDTLDTSDLPKNFHSSTQTLPPGMEAQQLSMTELRAVASAQFSAQSLATALYHIRLQAPLVVVDLRQESHGFINGNAVSWFSPNNVANFGKNAAAIAQDETQRLAKLAKNDSVTLNKILSKTTEGAVTTIDSPVTLTVKNVQSEKELVGMHSLGYVRFYIPDAWPPDDQQVDLFVQWVRFLPQGTWVYFHSGGGQGRTATFMMMYDMLRNAKRATFDDILKRQIAIGSMDLSIVDKGDPYKDPLAKSRLAFLQQFYKYCQKNQDNYKTPWSTWNKKYAPHAKK